LYSLFIDARIASLAHQLEDDGFHEIQLNGKQLVFLFMAATVVSVVIFLCGVLVGRGVRAERGAVADASTAANVPDTIAPQPAGPAPPAQPQTGADPTAAQPPGGEDLSYFRRLEKSNAPQERLKPAGSSGAAAPAPAANGPAEKIDRKAPKAEMPAPAKAPPPEPAPPKEAPRAAPAADSAAAEPTGDGFAVQIAALGVRGDADAIARRLSSKGYAAYVITPANGTPSVYRVRVGKFPTRREAESVAARLQREEQFKPWVTR
jgi:cell division septation protein DedD